MNLNYESHGFHDNENFWGVNYVGKREKGDDGEEVSKPTSEYKIRKLCLQENLFQNYIWRTLGISWNIWNEN